jgi:hypothetical protein
MSYKLKLESIDDIVKSLANDILTQTFMSLDKVDGEKLIALTNSRQVNSFIIRSLFNEWRKEVEQLESPYFDFKHEKVKAALKQFMNVLSNHISIDQAHLEPILLRAIKDSILISFAPDLFLEAVLSRSDTPQALKKELKYIKTHREVFKMLCDHMDEFETQASIKESLDAVDSNLFEEISPEDFAEKLGLSTQIEELFSFEEAIQPEPKQNAEMNLPKSEKPLEATINDQFQQGAKGLILAEKLQQSMKKSIESGLTLNEKFMFQNSLFGGDASKMKEALQLLDTATDLNDALNKANSFNQGWDMESEEIEAFMQVIEQRFTS